MHPPDEIETREAVRNVLLDQWKERTGQPLDALHFNQAFDWVLERTLAVISQSSISARLAAEDSFERWIKAQPPSTTTQ